MNLAESNRSALGWRESQTVNRPLQTKQAAGGVLVGGDVDPAALGVLSEDLFLKMLRLELRRIERSGRGFVLMLIDSGSLLTGNGKAEALGKLARVLSQSTRETDIRGWYSDSVLGVIFTEIDASARQSTVDAISSRTERLLSSTLPAAEVGQFKLSFHAFPENGDETSSDRSVLEEQFARGDRRKGVGVAIKRCMDILGSLCALILFSPLMMGIAIAIRLTSKGPVLFRQERVGLSGKKFTFLKFRSMYTAADQSIHKEYVQQFISGVAPSGGVYKLTKDPRVTPVGRVLRRTSMDELPQFFNVLLGSMSLVGPRPPIPYEVSRYGAWHKRRFLAVKPGITGLWQVNGRSKVKFDDMVRLDLRYAKSWSLWTDILILLQTPRAVLSRDGAY